MLVYILMTLLSSTSAISSNHHLLYKQNTAIHNHEAKTWKLLERFRREVQPTEMTTPDSRDLVSSSQPMVRFRREMQPTEMTTPDWDPVPSSQPPDPDYHTGSQPRANGADTLDHYKDTNNTPKPVFTHADGYTDSITDTMGHQSYEMPQMAAQASQQMAAASPNLYQSETRNNIDASVRSQQTESGPQRELIISDKGKQFQGKQLQLHPAAAPYNPLYMTRPGESPPLALPMSADAGDGAYVFGDGQNPELSRSGETSPVALPLSGGRGSHEYILGDIQNPKAMESGETLAVALPHAALVDNTDTPSEQIARTMALTGEPEQKTETTHTMDGQPVALAQKQRQRNQRPPPRHRKQPPPNKPAFRSPERKQEGPVKQRNSPPPSKPQSPSSRDRGQKVAQQPEAQPRTTEAPASQRPPAVNWENPSHKDPRNRPPPNWGRRTTSVDRPTSDWSVQSATRPADRAPYRPMAGSGPSLGPGMVGPPPGWVGGPEDHIDTQMDMVDHRRDYYTEHRYNPQYSPPRPLTPDGHRFPAAPNVDSRLPAGTPPAPDRYPYRDIRHPGPLYPQYPPYKLGDDEGFNGYRPEFSLDIHTGGGLRPCSNTSDPRCSLPSPMMEMDIETPYGEMDMEPGELDLEGPIAYQLLRTLGMGSPSMNPHAQEININHNVLNALQSRFGINTTAGIRRMASNRQFQTFMHRVLTHSAPVAMGEYNANLTKTEVDKLLINLNGSSADQRMPTGNLDDAKLSVKLTNKTGTNMTAKTAKLSSGVLTIDGQPESANGHVQIGSIWNQGESALPGATSALLQAQGTQLGQQGTVQALVQSILGVEQGNQGQEGEGRTGGEKEVKETTEATQGGAVGTVTDAGKIQKKSETRNATSNIHGTSLPHRENNGIATETADSGSKHRTQLQNGQQQPKKELGTHPATNSNTVQGTVNLNKTKASQHQEPSMNGKHAQYGSSQNQSQSNITNSAGANQHILNTKTGKNHEMQGGQVNSHGNLGKENNQNLQNLPSEKTSNNKGKGKLPNSNGQNRFNGNQGQGSAQNQQNMPTKQMTGNTKGTGKVPNGATQGHGQNGATQGHGQNGATQGHGQNGATHGQGLNANSKPLGHQPDTSLIHSGIIGFGPSNNTTIPTEIGVPAYKSTTAFAIAAVTLIAIAIILGPIVCILCQMNGRRREQLRKERAMKNREMSENNIMESMVLEEFGPKGVNSVANTGLEGATSVDYYSIDEAVDPSKNFCQMESERYTTLDDDLAERQKLNHGTDYLSHGFLP